MQHEDRSQRAEAAPRQGTGASRRLRRAGRVPGILYGGDKPAAADRARPQRALPQAAGGSVPRLDPRHDLDGEKQQVLLRDFQMHPFKPQVLHVDFQRVLADQKIHMKVPLHFMNAEISPGVKTGGGGRQARDERDRRHRVCRTTCRSSSRSTSRTHRRPQSMHVKDLAVPERCRADPASEARTRWSRRVACRRRARARKKRQPRPADVGAGGAGAGGEAAAGRAATPPRPGSPRRAGSPTKPAKAAEERTSKSGASVSTTPQRGGLTAARFPCHGHPSSSSASAIPGAEHERDAPQRRLLVGRAARRARARELSRASRAFTRDGAARAAARDLAAQARRPT